MPDKLLDKTEIDFITEILEDHLEDCKLWALAHFKVKQAKKASTLDIRIEKLSAVIKKLKS